MIVHHMGIACKNIYKAISSLNRIHHIHWKSKIIWDEDRRVNLCLVEINTSERYELIAGDLVNNMDGFYHVCYKVGDMSKSMKHMTQSGAIMVAPPSPAILFKNKKVCFFLTEYNSLVELLEA